MPLVYDEALYDDLYKIGNGDNVIHYERAFHDRAPDRFAQRRRRVMDRVPDNVALPLKIIVVGAGFGWTCEHLIDQPGVGTVVGVDPSPYVQANLATHGRGDIDILDATVGVDDMDAVLTAAGYPTSYNVVIDDDAASSHSDAELPAFFDALEALGNVMIHFTSPRNPAPYARQDSRINFKTIPEWRALRPGHQWIDARWKG